MNYSLKKVTFNTDKNEVSNLIPEFMLKNICKSLTFNKINRVVILKNVI